MTVTCRELLENRDQRLSDSRMDHSYFIVGTLGGHIIRYTK